jgi:hypothetical protein
VLLDLQEQQAQQVLLDPLERQDLQEPLGLQAQTEQQVLLVLLVLLAQQVRQALLVRQAL